MPDYQPLFELNQTALNDLNIVVLKGGPGSERQVSLASGAAVANALRSQGHRITEIDVTDECVKLPKNTDLVYNMIHGTFGEDGALQALLEQKGVPFTGEGSRGSRLAFDKILTKRKFMEASVPTPPFEILQAGQQPSAAPPFVLKAPRQGSTIGVHIVRDRSQIGPAMADCLKYDHEVLLEAFFPGKELTVSIVADLALPIIEIIPNEETYNYQSKYVPGKSSYFVPARISPSETEMIQKAALAAHNALGLRSYSRVDILLNEAGGMAVLELNTIPGMTSTSLMPKAAAAIGLDFPAICKIIGVLALQQR
ncbi:MAG: D-alanine--D-alanine ligase [Verrucomicrobia bacterium]|nr:MAG: D-alanine--D-alanine ligase [Verrucomicrobiota bacterium]